MGEALLYEDYRDALSCPTCFFERNNENLPHFHSAIELISVTKGSLCATISGKQVTAAQGELLVIPSSEIHMFQKKDLVEDIVLMIPLNYIPAFEQLFAAKTFVNYILSGENACKVCALIQQLADIQPDPKSPIIRGYTYLILGYVVQYLPMKDKQIHDKLLIRSIVSYIEDHYTDPLTIKSIAEIFKYTESRMSHFFNEMMGCSFPDYLGKMRTKKAIFLLIHEKYSVTDTAMAAGFESLRTFYRVFKKNCGMTPLQYKKSLELQEAAALTFSGTYNGNGYFLKVKNDPVSAAFAPPFFWFVKGTIVNTGFVIDLGKTASTTYGICRQFSFGSKMLNCCLIGTMDAANDTTTVLAGTSMNTAIDNMYTYVTITGKEPGPNSGVSVKGTNTVNHYYYVENGCVKRYGGEIKVTAEELASLAPTLTANAAVLKAKDILFCSWGTKKGLPVMQHDGGYRVRHPMSKESETAQEGTMGNPYLISSADDFVKMQNQMKNGETFAGKYFLQTADICLNDCADYRPLASASNGTNNRI